MNAVRLKAHLSSETLTLSSPELKAFVGKDIVIIVCEQEPVIAGSGELTSRGFMRGTVLRYDDPFEPAVPPEDWEAVS
jgi:hypothetical protein